MNAEWAAARLTASRVARLATVDAGGLPHLVPIVFALSGQTIYSAVDAKPKSTLALKRLDNIANNPGVSVLVDEYSEDWTRLWWARADATARILLNDDPEAVSALVELADRYPQYRSQPPPGPVIALDVTRWSAWAATDPDTPVDAASQASTRPEVAQRTSTSS